MGVRGVQKGKNHVTIVLTKKMFLMFFTLVKFGAETTVPATLLPKIVKLA